MQRKRFLLIDCSLLQATDILGELMDMNAVGETTLTIIHFNDGYEMEVIIPILELFRMKHIFNTSLHSIIGWKVRPCRWCSSFRGQSKIL